MTLPQRTIDVIARTLPPFARERYREEWNADLNGANELDLPPASIVWGAIVTAVTIDRDAPEVTGLTLSAVAAHRARWSLAAFVSAGILSTGLLFWGGYGVANASANSTLGAALVVAVGFFLKIAAIAFVVVGVLAAVRAIVTRSAASRQSGVARKRISVSRLSSTTLWVGIVIVLTAGLVAVMPLAVVAIAVLATPIVVVIAASSRVAHHRVLPSLRSRLLIGIATVVFTFSAVAVGTLHIVVWNPLAAVPGLALDAIYAQMAAVGESPLPHLIWVWGVFWSLAALAFAVICVAPKIGGRMSARGLTVSGLAIIGLTLSCEWLAGFSTGMSLADTFAISGGDSAASGPALAILGQLCLVVSVWLLLLPARTNAGRLPEQTTRVVTN